ncbi:MAG: hypothetical protein IJ532_08925 [Alphaproteobacteria bacterium]|nr:hypothetical protein [Alphaproteobacteria bacterium]
MKKFVLILGLVLSLSANASAENNSFKDCDFIIYNKCISCDTPYAFEVGYNSNCTMVCPNRDVLYEGVGYYSRKFCFLKQCPDDKPYRDSDGSCYEDENHIPRWDNEYKGFYDMYADATADEIWTFSANNGKCPQEAPLLEQNKCFSCFEIQNLSISEKECDKCPNRKYIYSKQWKHGECTLPCPSNKPLKRWDGKCFSCDEKKAVALETWCNFDIDCDVCPNRTILYSVGGNIPSILNCPPNKPLMDSHGVCYSCDTPQYIDVKWNGDLCTKICSNRYLDTTNDSCILNGMKFE